MFFWAVGAILNARHGEYGLHLQCKNAFISLFYRLLPLWARLKMMVHVSYGGEFLKLKSRSRQQMVRRQFHISVTQIFNDLFL